MSIRVFAGGAVAAGLMMTSCGGDDGGGLGTGDDYSVSGALTELPASLDSGGFRISTADLNAASDAAGVERPDDPDDVDAVAQWLMPMTGGAVDDPSDQVAYVPLETTTGVFVPRNLHGMKEFREELGWSFADADSYVDYSMPPTQLSVISGSFDDETLNADLIELEGGVVTNSDDEDEAQSREDGRMDVDSFGRPVRMAQDGDRIVSSPQTPSVEEWVAGPEETLADDEDLLAVAEALDDAEVFSAYLSRPEAGFSSAPLLRELTEERDVDMDEPSEQLPDEQLESLPPSPFDTVGIGWGVDDEGAVITIAYQHGSDDAASANAEALEDVLTNGVSFQTARPLVDLYDLVDVETDGTVVVVTLHLGPDGLPSHIMHALQAGDVPFVHR